MKTLILVTLCALAATAVSAQGQPPGGGAPLEQPGVSPAEIQRMFDACAPCRRRSSSRSATTVPQFLTRFKALQDVRRKALQERTRIIQDLRRLTNDAQPDDGQMKDRLKALQELEGGRRRTSERPTTDRSGARPWVSRRSSAYSKN
jgi:hypothetical protein